MTEAKKTGVDNPYRYSTKEWDEKSGLYYFGARYYSPEVGRWTQRDPAGEVDGLNLYGYMGGDPVGSVDAFGLVRCIFGERITQVLAVGPRDALRAYRLAREAAEQANSLTELDGWVLTDWDRDAFRHCYWSCRMARELGVLTASTVARVHEDCVPNPPADRAMDEFNNSMGRLVARETCSCRSGCISALEDGTLQRSPEGEPGPPAQYPEFPGAS